MQDPNVRVGATAYSDRASVEAAAAGQFEDEVTPDYYNTFEILCYYVLNRII